MRDPLSLYLLRVRRRVQASWTPSPSPRARVPRAPMGQAFINARALAVQHLLLA